ncbi:MAG: hypothetical protein CMJ23_00355 [Phycisphaerae bacterium]|nr:hypothetical protein [Phycisphaerae bacterium]
MAEEKSVHPQTAEVSLRFRASPILGVLALLVLWPAGAAYGVIGLVFGLGLLGLCAAIGLPRSVDLMFGMVLALTLFAAQFLGAVFLGIQAGGDTVSVVFTTVILWFVQLTVVSWDLHRSAKTILVGRASSRDKDEKAKLASAGDEVGLGR